MLEGSRESGILSRLDMRLRENILARLIRTGIIMHTKINKDRCLSLTVIFFFVDL